MLFLKNIDLISILIKTLFRIKKLREKDLEQLRKEKSLHNLLTIIVDAQEKLYHPEYANVATDVEKQSILNKCSEVHSYCVYLS